MDESLLLRFKSDDTINSKGFSAAYVIIDDNDNYDYDSSLDDHDVGGDGDHLLLDHMANVNLDGMVVDQVTTPDL